jgi:hypothetical protein
LWIPQSFPLLRWDKSSFPAEATISRFTNRGRVFHTVILRNVDERLAAERRIALLSDETEYLRESMRELSGMGDMLGASPAMKELFEALKRVAVTEPRADSAKRAPARSSLPVRFTSLARGRTGRWSASIAPPFPAR